MAKRVLTDTSFEGNLNVDHPGTPDVSIRTTADSAQDAKVTIGGARTASATSEIGALNFRNHTSSAYDMARVVAKDPAGSHTQGRGSLTFQTADAGVLTDRFVIGYDGAAEFYQSVTIQGGTAWHANNDGTGSGLDADLLDGQHASAFAQLTGATFTGGITATTFAGNGANVTDVDAAYLGGQAPSSYALLSGATFTGTVTAANFSGDGASITDLNASQLTTGTVPTARLPAVETFANAFANVTGNISFFVNDGGGNQGMRFNATPGATNNLVENGHAWMLRIDNDSVAGDFYWRRGTSATGVAGEAITWDNWLLFDGGLDQVEWYKDLDLNNNDLLGVGVTNTSQLGVGGATPDATNTFAFYGTDLLLNSGGSINMKYNKNAAGNDASMTFQTGFTTYGLMGLLGNNDFTIKVGTGFTAAMIAKESDGTVSFPEGIKHDTFTAYKTSNQTLTDSFATLAAYDGTHVAASGNLSWNGTTGESYVGKAGRFMISYSVSTEISTGSSRSDSLAVLQKWNGTAWSDVAGTQHRMYNRVAARGGSCAAWSGILDAAATDGFRVAVRREDGTDTIIVDSASFSISRL